ncbi:MAG: glycosyl transferase [Flavobacterium sp.]|nr:glycosyl transferase [Flavobacterium sp.]
MKKNLILISQEQFGYHADAYYYCKYLKSLFNITYICWEHGLQRISMDDINIIYVARRGDALSRSIVFIQIVLNEINQNQKENTIIFIKYFKIIPLILRIFKPKHTIVFDIRTGNIFPQRVRRIINDLLLEFESVFFDNITVISQSLSYKLKLNHKAHILPIGADIISDSLKDFKELNLLYVGTLFNRNIDATIKGFQKFYNEYNQKIRMKYTIVGSGLNNEEEILRNLVMRYDLSNVITITGQIPRTQLQSYFDSHNIGISYVPMEEYYDCQPVTKTFEYLLSGMPVIATNTLENNKIIRNENGILVNDNSDSFYNGLIKIWQNRSRYDSQKIRNKFINFTWEKIVSKNLKPYLEGL